MKLIRVFAEQRRHVGAGKEAFLRVDAQLLARIDDVEVAHRNACFALSQSSKT